MKNPASLVIFSGSMAAAGLPFSLSPSSRDDLVLDLEQPRHLVLEFLRVFTPAANGQDELVDVPLRRSPKTQERLHGVADLLKRGAAHPAKLR